MYRNQQHTKRINPITAYKRMREEIMNRPFDIYIGNDLRCSGFETRKQAEQYLEDNVFGGIKDKISYHQDMIKELKKDLKDYRVHAEVYENVLMDRKGDVWVD